MTFTTNGLNPPKDRPSQGSSRLQLTSHQVSLPTPQKDQLKMITDIVDAMALNPSSARRTATAT
jgi:hypothetical protein